MSLLRQKVEGEAKAFDVSRQMPKNLPLFHNGTIFPYAHLACEWNRFLEKRYQTTVTFQRPAFPNWSSLYFITLHIVPGNDSFSDRKWHEPLQAYWLKCLFPKHYQVLKDLFWQVITFPVLLLATITFGF